MKQTIVTCDGCGKKGEPDPGFLGQLDVRRFRAEFMEGERGQGRTWRPTIEVDLCHTCRDRFDELRDALDPQNWPRRAAREPMQQQEHREPEDTVAS